MADGSKADVAVAPALGISLSIKLNNARELVIQTHIALEESSQELNALLDRLLKATDRQVAKYILMDLNKELRQREQALKDQAEDLARVEADNHKRWDDSGRKGPYKLDAKESAALNNIEISKGKFKADIADIKARIAENEAKLLDTA